LPTIILLKAENWFLMQRGGDRRTAEKSLVMIYKKNDLSRVKLEQKREEKGVVFREEIR